MKLHHSLYAANDPEENALVADLTTRASTLAMGMDASKQVPDVHIPDMYNTMLPGVDRRSMFQPTLSLSSKLNKDKRVSCPLPQISSKSTPPKTESDALSSRPSTDLKVPALSMQTRTMTSPRTRPGNKAVRSSRCVSPSVSEAALSSARKSDWTPDGSHFDESQGSEEEESCTDVAGSTGLLEDLEVCHPSHLHTPWSSLRSSCVWEHYEEKLQTPSESSALLDQTGPLQHRSSDEATPRSQPLARQVT